MEEAAGKLLWSERYKRTISANLLQDSNQRPYQQRSIEHVTTTPHNRNGHLIPSKKTFSSIFGILFFLLISLFIVSH